MAVGSSVGRHSPRPSHRKSNSRSRRRNNGYIGSPLGSQNSFYATCHPGMERILQAELHHLGITHTESGRAGVAFTLPSSSSSLLYSALLSLRTCIRILFLLSAGALPNNHPDPVYEHIRSLEWPLLLPEGASFAISSTVSSSGPHAVNVRARDAICDAIVDARGKRPLKPEEKPDVSLYIHVYDDEIKVYRDLCGDSLHRRGYRGVGAATHKAQLNACAAAGILLMAGWDGWDGGSRGGGEGGGIFGRKETAFGQGIGTNGTGGLKTLADPFAGSGTILLEAGLIATNTSPGLLRDSNNWSFLHWPDFKNSEVCAWNETVERKREAEMRWRKTAPEFILQGNDVHAGSLDLFRRAAKLAGIENNLELNVGEAGKYVPSKKPGLVVCNPPWGRRLETRRGESIQGGGAHRGADSDDCHEDAWKQLGVFLKTQCRGSYARILSGTEGASRHLGLRSYKNNSLTLGGIKCRVLTYHIRPESE